MMSNFALLWRALMASLVLAVCWLGRTGHGRRAAELVDTERVYPGR